MQPAGVAPRMASAAAATARRGGVELVIIVPMARRDCKRTAMPRSSGIEATTSDAADGAAAGSDL
jgi:hypothetical protein